MLLFSAFGLSQFPKRLVVVSLRFSSCFAVGFISYAHCISGPLLSSLANKSRKKISVSRIYREACFSWLGLQAGMSSKAT